MRVKKLTCVMFLVISANCYCQPGIGFTGTARVIPPSPGASDLGKYGQIPVSLNTGTINIDIPLYEINTPKLRLPISISYLGAGIKVDDLASSVGLGWILNAGGVIARSVVGLPDEGVNGYLESTNTNIGKKSYELVSAFPTEVQYVDFLKNVSDGNIDTEPDMFFFHFANKSGRFIFDRSTKKAVCIPYSDFKIDYFVAGNEFSSFRVIDEKGIIYDFTSPEYSTTFKYQNDDFGVRILDNGNELGYNVSGWYITKIISPDYGDTIKFIYNSIYQTSKQNFFDFYAELGSKRGTGSEQAENVNLGKYPRSETSITSSQPVLQEIQFKNGKVSFSMLSDRKDMSAFTMGGSSNGDLGRITELTVYNKIGNNYKQLKKIKSIQDYFTSDPVINGQIIHPQNFYRLKLNGIREYDENNNFVKEHKFEYNSISLPPRLSYIQDKWGYANDGKYNKGLLPEQYVTNPFNRWTYKIGNGDRTVSTNTMMGGILTKITYPTGGYTEFQFSPHQYSVTEPGRDEMQLLNITEALKALPGVQHLVSYSFVHNGPTAQGSIGIDMPAYSNMPMDRKPYVSIKDKLYPAREFTYASHDPTHICHYEAPYVFIEGREYTITAYVHADSPEGAYAQIQANHSVYKTVTIPDQQITVQGSGVRIESVTNFYAGGKFATKELYKYGESENGNGKLVACEKARNFYSRHYEYQYLDPNNNGEWGDKLEHVKCYFPRAFNIFLIPPYHFLF